MRLYEIVTRNPKDVLSYKGKPPHDFVADEPDERKVKPLDWQNMSDEELQHAFNPKTRAANKAAEREERQDRRSAENSMPSGQKWNFRLDDKYDLIQTALDGHRADLNSSPDEILRALITSAVVLNDRSNWPEGAVSVIHDDVNNNPDSWVSFFKQHVSEIEGVMKDNG